MTPRNGIIVATLYLTLEMLVFLFAGCTADQPPSPLVDNKQQNVLTDRQRLVREFHTAEVFSIPSDDTEFVVRDTNGAVWFVRNGRGTQVSNSGKTIVFGQSLPKPLLIEEPLSDEEQAKQAALLVARVALDAMAKTNMPAK